jgi:hypothetical protein
MKARGENNCSSCLPFFFWDGSVNSAEAVSTLLELLHGNAEHIYFLFVSQDVAPSFMNFRKIGLL